MVNPLRQLVYKNHAKLVLYYCQYIFKTVRQELPFGRKGENALREITTLEVVSLPFGRFGR
jgi:hypothetical protein